MAAAVNLQTLSSNGPFDFLPPHSRSASISSSSPHSRPHSSQDILSRMPPGIPPPSGDPYRLSSYLPGDQVRHSSVYSLPSADMSPGDSPPHSNMTNPAFKGHIRQTHLRARAAASPYPRDTESVHSSSSETDDLTMFLGNPDYSTMYGPGQPMPTNHQEPRQSAGVFGRMSINPDHALQKLAANVRVATTTSASDRAKQIFVQAWCVPIVPLPCSNFLHFRHSG
jgi:regulatory factor X